MKKRMAASIISSPADHGGALQSEGTIPGRSRRAQHLEMQPVQALAEIGTQAGYVRGQPRAVELFIDLELRKPFEPVLLRLDPHGEEEAGQGLAGRVGILE